MELMVFFLSFYFYNSLTIALLPEINLFFNVITLQSSKDGSITALIWGASPQTRSDRQKDRVETNPEQLAAASAQAEISFYALKTNTFRIIQVHLCVLISHLHCGINQRSHYVNINWTNDTGYWVVPFTSSYYSSSFPCW